MRVFTFDTTLRDGTQGEAVSFSAEDKVLIAHKLDELGIDYIEGGWPGSNPKDKEFFTRAKDLQLKHSRLVAFGATRFAKNTVESDPSVQAILEADTPVVSIFGKSWKLHVERALGITEEENLTLIADTVRYLKANGKEVVYDAEHFFDGYKADRGFALRTLEAAQKAGADVLVLCDTNGGTMTSQLSEICADVRKHFDGVLGIHTHNDAELAVANTLAAVEQGFAHVQGCMNGYGERCGNANLTSIIPTLMLKSDYAERFETCVTPEKLRTLTHASRILDEMLNRAPNRHAPYVGESAFAHKGGIHVSAVQKDPRTYEHVPPEAIGNRRKLLVSDQAGRSNILAELERIGIVTPKDDPRIVRLLDEVKQREAQGYAYEAADASFELLARRVLGNVPHFFDVDAFRVTVERRHNAAGNLVTVSEATVKVRIDGESVLSAGEGNGPVNALDNALRKDLGRYQGFIDDLELVDYKVRILTGGTDAVTRVLIESRDGVGNRWFTVGVSPNIVDASFEALIDSINYKLIRDGAPAP